MTSPLVVEVKAGRNLVAADSGGTSDPYVLLRVPGTRQKGRTKVIKKTLNPTWNETFHLSVPVSLLQTGKLECTVWDKDMLSDDAIGEFSLPFPEIGAGVDKWCKLQKVPKGEIHLVVKLGSGGAPAGAGAGPPQAAAPPPAGRGYFGGPVAANPYGPPPPVAGNPYAAQGPPPAGPSVPAAANPYGAPPCPPGTGAMPPPGAGPPGMPGGPPCPPGTGAMPPPGAGPPGMPGGPPGGGMSPQHMAAAGIAGVGVAALGVAAAHHLQGGGAQAPTLGPPGHVGSDVSVAAVSQWDTPSLQPGGPEVPIPSVPGADLVVGLSWNFAPGMPKVDLDCSALLFDAAGLLLEAAFYNNLECFGGSLRHSGDNRSGEGSGFDETIVIDVDRLHPSVHQICFVVNAHSGGSFAQLDGAAAVSYQPGKQPFLRTVVTCPPQCDAKGLVLAVLRRDQRGWQARAVGTLCPGHTFASCMREVRGAVDQFVDRQLAARRQLRMDRTYNMEKGDIVRIPVELFRKGEDVFVGLGWEAPGGLDLDASVLVQDFESKLISTVYWGCKDFHHGAVRHGGDNLTGAGSGDDERIDVDLDRIPQNVSTLWIVVNIYTSGKTFKLVRDAYVRLCAVQTGFPLARFPLTGHVTSRGLVFCRIFRTPDGGWAMEALGKGCGGAVATDRETLSACGM
eukprot:TRINITY_DN1193_c0_g1_i1.p1 TRINITY_DN1193_c0_g1~~TRINITY_DN1193_c0_g1_i1.p1  ORF type:complete len:701 (+),score=227.11 TRINITY_DN1193_c0_g1_i1:74-2104(+)